MIDELEANFERGLNVITGETGAGKSILINAIDLAFSTRVSKDVIKTGREKAVIELTIDDKILTKEITKSGSRTRLDGVVISAEEVKELRAKYLDIHSQHQTYTFLQPKYHITLLDNYAKNEKLAIYREKFAVYRQMQTELETLQSAADKTQSELEFLRFQIDEISAAELKGADEVEVLKAELEVLENAEKLQELTGIAYWAINGDEGSVLESLGKIKQNVSKAASFDAKLARAEQTGADNDELGKHGQNEWRKNHGREIVRAYGLPPEFSRTKKSPSRSVKEWTVHEYLPAHACYLFYCCTPHYEI